MREKLHYMILSFHQFVSINLYQSIVKYAAIPHTTPHRLPTAHEHAICGQSCSTRRRRMR
jgi:hypothetical protein